MSRILLTILLFISAGYHASVARSTDVYAPQELVCRVTSAYTIDSINNTFGTSLKDYSIQTKAYLLETPAGENVDSLAEEISYSSDVIYCQPNYYLDAPEGVQSSQPFIDFASTGTYENQPAALSLDIEATSAVSTGAGVQVAVIDGGVDMTHPLLSTNVISRYDFVDNDNDATDEPGGTGSGHGTFIAGIIRLIAPEAQIDVYRVLDTSGRGDGFSVSKAIVEAVDDGSSVINLSLVTGIEHPSVHDALVYAIEHDVLVFAAAGNDSLNTVRYPAADTLSLAVAALDSIDIKADFSNYHENVGVCAPGTRVYAPYPGGMYAWWSGTSFSTPFVAGEAAALKAANPWAGRQLILQAIVTSATGVDSLNTEIPGLLGAGLIDPYAALQTLATASCGDIDQSGQTPDIADLTLLIDHLFISSQPLLNELAADLDGQGAVDIGDLTYFIKYLFLDGPAPACGPTN